MKISIRDGAPSRLHGRGQTGERRHESAVGPYGEVECRPFSWERTVTPRVSIRVLAAKAGHQVRREPPRAGATVANLVRGFPGLHDAEPSS